MIGVLSLPIAAMLISVSLSRTQPWSAAKKVLLWTANLTWTSLVLFVASLVILIVTYTQAGGHMPTDGQSLAIGATLPSGVIAVVGYANRLLLVPVWVVAVSWEAIKVRSLNENI